MRRPGDRFGLVGKADERRLLNQPIALRQDYTALSLRSQRRMRTGISLTRRVAGIRIAVVPSYSLTLEPLVVKLKLVTGTR